MIGAAQVRGESLTVYSDSPLSLVLLCLTSILITAYLLNQIFDKESDEKNDKLYYLSRGIFHARTLVIMAVVFFVIASLSFQQVDDRFRPPLVLALALSLLYSLPPIRLCARPFLDVLANAIGYGGIAYILGFLSLRHAATDAMIGAAPFVLLVASTFLHTTILDVVGDAASAKITTAVFIGTRRSNLVALLFHILAVVTGVFTTNFLATLVTAVTLPVTFIAWRKGTKGASSMQIQITTLAVTLAAIVFWPIYAVVVVPLILLSRMYYRRRFGLIYPGPQKSA